MNALPLTLLCTVLTMGCSVVPTAMAAQRPVSQAEQKTREELVRETNAMIDSVSARVSERDLAASIASEHVALLHHRAGKLRLRAEQMTRREQALLEPHFNWLAQVHTTTT